MTNFLQTGFHYRADKTGGALKFPEHNEAHSGEVCALFEKYHDELVFLSAKLLTVRNKI